MGMGHRCYRPDIWTSSMRHLWRCAMTFIVLRRASSDRWEAVGPRLCEMSEFEAESHARNLAQKYPNQKYANARIVKVFCTESDVVVRGMEDV